MQTDPLAQLRDIHLPPPIHPWWPLASGYLLLLTLCVAILFFYGLHAFIRHQKNKPKRDALRLLAQIEHHYTTHQNLVLAATQIHTLLKRVALVYYPRERVADLHGHAFIHFLNQTSKHLDFEPFQPFFTTYPYQKHAVSIPEKQFKHLLDNVRRWMQQQPRGKS